MPKNLSASIERVLQQLASQVVEAVRADLSQQLGEVLAGREAARPSLGRGGAGKARHVPKHCLVAGCQNPSKGPRWSFLCDQHKSTGKKERSALLAAWKSSQGAKVKAAKVGRKRRAKAHG